MEEARDNRESDETARLSVERVFVTVDSISRTAIEQRIPSVFRCEKFLSTALPSPLPLPGPVVFARVNFFFFLKNGLFLYRCYVFSKTDIALREFLENLT